ncbi:hypothetical protein V3C99_018221 [Haemonchus contortus]|uniref:Piwi domain-containing protein n=1 Tax=Haemonchus contortus TaxID=6289 RepID=A0A7I4Z3M9_HAECO
MTSLSSTWEGLYNVVADAPSRAVNPVNKFQDNTAEAVDNVDFPISINLALASTCFMQPTIHCLGPPLAIRPYDALQEQRQDRLCKAIFKFIETQCFPEGIMVIYRRAMYDREEWLPLQ